MRYSTTAAGILLAAWLTMAALQQHAEAKPLAMLWELGTPDDNTAEFALAPNGHGQFSRDAFYIVGASDPIADWPYVHPGPADGWAGARRHAFTIVFALDRVPDKGQCSLGIDFVDTHSSAPPKLSINVNGHAFFRDAPRGGGDASISGDPTKGKEHIITLEFPVTHLRPGNNQVKISTISGSWVLYDWIGFAAPSGVALATVSDDTLVSSMRAEPVLLEQNGRLHQVVQMDVCRVGQATDATLSVGDAPPTSITLSPGQQTVEALAPAVEQEQVIPVEVVVAGKTVGKSEVTLKPVRKWVVYLLHHTHLDIGYTHLQTEVEQRQWEHLEYAIELAEKTANYPEGSRFKWLPEGLWAIDSYLKQATPEKREAFVDAVQKDWISLDALYGNELTALCRPEELIRLTDYARRVEQITGVPIDSAMITDVPGYTWGMVPALAHAGIKYFSIGPNAGHRIGYTLSEWGDKPFYWVSPSGEEKVLCWVAGKAYSWFHRAPIKDGQGIMQYLNELESNGYPYDMVHVRYNIGGDNGPPDPNLPEFVKEWNAKYAYPKLVITTNSAMFREFEERYADVIPSFSGDFTPYWEDGAASSSRETAVNREAAERLVQAETLFAMLDPKNYPAEDFYQAWRNVLLYNEHTWGAHNSISEPEVDFVKGQWAIKQAFALDADKQSRAILESALATWSEASTNVRAVQVCNTCSWLRTDLVTLPKEWSLPGDRVKNSDGTPVPSQRLTSGELVFLAENVPPLGTSTFTIEEGAAHVAVTAKAEGNRADNRLLAIAIDEATGAITSLKSADRKSELVDNASGLGLNDYFYVAGRDPKEPQRNGPATVTVKEAGPLVASLLIESDAPGCHKLTREVRIIAGLNRVDLIDTLDKENIYAQEGVHLAFPFNVPDGVMRINVPWGVVRPEADQLAGACKNYFTVQRWVDISNQDYGVTCATIDAPLLEVGAITNDPRVVGWIEKLEPTQTFYSYVMNNYWETNYKAGQEGPTVFRYSIQPHGVFDAAAAERFGTERDQPLLVVPTPADATDVPSFLRVEPSGVLVSTLKPSEDGDAWIVRLYGASGKPEQATLTWDASKQPKMYLSNLKEEKGSRIKDTVDVPPYGMVTLRVKR